MRFFNVLPIIATIVFSGLALASPISSVKATAAIHDRAPSVQARSNQIASIPVILTTVSGKIAPIVYELKSLDAASCTTSHITPLLEELVDTLNSGVEDLKHLTGKTVVEILRSVDGTTQDTVLSVAKLLCQLVTAIVVALSQVLHLVNGKISVLGPVLGSVGNSLARFLCGVIILVNGLLIELIPLVLSLSPTFELLEFDIISVIFGIVH